MGRDSCWTAKRGSFGARNRGCPCKEGKGSEGGAVGRPGSITCRERSLSLFGSFFSFFFRKVPLLCALPPGPMQRCPNLSTEEA